MEENKELKTIKHLSKNFKGMKERFKNPNPSLFKNNAALFLDDLCTAFEINDLKLNHLAIAAYSEVCEVLEEKIFDKSTRNLTEIRHFIMVLESFMKEFYAQTANLYD